MDAFAKILRFKRRCSTISKSLSNGGDSIQEEGKALLGVPANRLEIRGLEFVVSETVKIEAFPEPPG